MKNILTTAAIMLFGGTLSAQIIVDNVTQTPEQLVQNVLVGTGVTVSNITFNSSVPMAQSAQPYVGYFDASGTLFPISEGIVLTTGNANLCVGPNNSTGDGNWQLPGNYPSPDPDLVAINTPGINICDQALLEFDFVPTGDSISFNYIFGSDEYPEYVNGGFNDAFGFFISGPGIVGTYQFSGINMALIPGTTTPVTIDNVNIGQNSQYYVNNAGGLDIEYDGHTVVLQAGASVQCGETYHIKLGINDAGDGIYDSGVFLEANSFSSNSPDISIQLVDVNGDPLVGNELIEGCSSAAINLIKPNGYTDSSYVVNINVSGSATNGTDYTQINPSYTIPPGIDTLTILIDALADLLAESTETLFISTYYVTPCGDTVTVTALINIIDNPPAFNVFADDVVLDCPTSMVPVTAWTDGGIPNLIYNWGVYGIGTTANLPGNIPGTTTYTVTVTDECGMVQDTTVNVTLNAAPVPTIDFNQNTFIICPGDNADIDATVVNPYDPLALTYLWNPTGQTIEDITVSPSVLTWYYLTINDGCYSVTDSVKVEMGTVNLTAINITDATNCPGQPGLPGAISVLPNDPSWTYTLIGGGNTFGPQTSGNFNGLNGGIVYFLNVVNDDGCSIDTAVTVGLGANAVTANFVLDSLRDVTCFGDNDGGAYVININGGITPPFDVTWTHTSGLFDSETVLANGTSEHDDLFGGQWVVTVTDQEGCAWSQLFTIAEPGDLTLDWIFNDPTCYQFTDGSVTVSTTGGNGGNTFSIWDSALNILNPGNTNTANTLGEGWYYATITDSEGCFNADSIFLDDPDELAIDLNIMQPLCYGFPTGIAIVDTVYNYNGNYNQIAYFWNPNPSAIPNGIGASYINHLGPGSYTLQINDAAGCDNTFDFTIAYPPELVFSQLGTEPAYCRLFSYQSGNGVVFASASGGASNFTYTWTNLQTGATSNNTTWGGLNPGDYFISVVDGNGCYLTDTITLDSLNPIASYDVSSAEFLTPGLYEGTAPVCVTFTNTSQYYANPNNPNADTTFFWNLDTPNAAWQISHDVNEVFDTCYLQSGNYEVCLIAINKNGCADTTCNTMIIFDPLHFTPVNIFTPNGDGDNDVFTFNYWAQAVATFECTIVNRWGATVHIMNNIADEWDGTDMNGSPCSDGIYFYTYSGTATDGTPFSGQGFTHIVGSGI